MSEPIRAPAAGKLANGPGGHKLIGNIGTGTATGACSGLTNGVNGDRNATTRGRCDIGVYDTGGAS